MRAVRLVTVLLLLAGGGERLSAQRATTYESQIGLSAQEVERAFPELVTTDSQGHLSVAYANVSAVLVRAAQEQQEEVLGHRAETDELRLTIREQQTQINLLLARQNDVDLLRAEIESLRAALDVGPIR